jgi:hypothetical protein
LSPASQREGRVGRKSQPAPSPRFCRRMKFRRSSREGNSDGQQPFFPSLATRLLELTTATLLPKPSMSLSMRRGFSQRLRPYLPNLNRVPGCPRPARYRQIHSAIRRTDEKTRSPILPLYFPLRPPYSSPLALPPAPARPPKFRKFSSFSPLHQTHVRNEDAENRPGRAAPGAEQQTEKAGKSAKDDSTTSGDGREEAKQEGPRQGKSPPPPPPPHGDKTPWQVFTETLRSEFKASKEWNESTKALASSAHQFTENESIKRARAAYTAASEAAGSTTSSALKNTGKAIGHGAAWAWDTPVVRGVRSGANAAGRGLDRVTKPVRETAAFKSVKEVIDDGSSSRYGGWVEKEERRKARELRQLNESKKHGRRIENMEEDPK